MMKNTNYVSSLIEYIIAHEEVDRRIFPQHKVTDLGPNWGKIRKIIAKKYNKYYGDKVTLDGQIRYSGTKKDYKRYYRYTGEMLKKYASEMSNYQVNSFAWGICQFSKSKSDVNAALKAIKKVAATETDSANHLPAYMDTYANLLYRQGKKKEAIQVEEKAYFYIEKADAPQESKRMFKETIQKMKKDEVMWPVNYADLH